MTRVVPVDAAFCFNILISIALSENLLNPSKWKTAFSGYESINASLVNLLLIWLLCWRSNIMSIWLVGMSLGEFVEFVILLVAVSMDVVG